MNNDPNHDHDRDSDHANDNGEHEGFGGKQVAPAPAGGRDDFCSSAPNGVR